MLVADQSKYKREEEAAGSALMLHFKKEHQPAPAAAFWADLQCLSMVSLELEIRSAKLFEFWYFKTFTNARYVSHPPYTSQRSEGNLRKA